MERLIKENIIYVLVIFVVIGFGVYFNVTQISATITDISQANSQKKELKTKQAELAKIKQEKEEEELKIQQGLKKETGSGKVIYEMLGQQISPEASFGILFEDVLANIADAGIRIRSIDYNFQVADDKIALASVPGYNVCELSFLAVGKYPQFQTFFKTLARDKYLSGISEIYIEPYDKDKSILIARFKVRLYTKTI